MYLVQEKKCFIYLFITWLDEENKLTILKIIPWNRILN